MKKRTKALQIDRKTADRVIERDGECVLCRLGFIEEINPCDMGAYIHDIAHFIPRSQGGLGIEKKPRSVMQTTSPRTRQRQQRKAGGIP